MKQQLVLFVVNDAGFFLSHRLPLAQAARDQGYKVAVATPTSDAVGQIEAEGFRHYAVPLSRGGAN
ncbi:MAG: glycosyltransferase family 1 protein, partial [Candidatus Thiodiazotropha taylori]|nr:glycosyltransferase family 1 protein [Candidatus Thiodiazotropha taylori]